MYTDLDECIIEVAEEIEACGESFWARPQCTVEMLRRVLTHLRRLEDLDETI